MAIAAVILLKEHLTVWRVGGLVLGFAGVVALIWPELRLAHVSNARLAGFVLALFSAFMTAIALIMVRSLNRTESPGAIALYFVLASMFGALLTLPLGWTLPNGWTLALLIGAGIFGGFAHIAMTLAFRFAEASRIAPFEYIALGWPILADVFIFRLQLSNSFLLALTLITLGALVAASEKKKVASKRSEERPLVVFPNEGNEQKV
jgi:drug/metabolite transporter (DMT)-like permease